jgi:hypothetical protein
MTLNILVGVLEAKGNLGRGEKEILKRVLEG